jgi:hypothetical protein
MSLQELSFTAKYQGTILGRPTKPGRGGREEGRCLNTLASFQMQHLAEYTRYIQATQSASTSASSSMHTEGLPPLKIFAQLMTISVPLFTKLARGGGCWKMMSTGT